MIIIIIIISMKKEKEEVLIITILLWNTVLLKFQIFIQIRKKIQMKVRTGIWDFCEHKIIPGWHFPVG